MSVLVSHSDLLRVSYFVSGTVDRAGRAESASAFDIRCGNAHVVARIVGHQSPLAATLAKASLPRRQMAYTNTQASAVSENEKHEIHRAVAGPKEAVRVRIMPSSEPSISFLCNPQHLSSLG